MQFLADWGTEILFSLVSLGIVSYFKHQGSKFKKKISDYEELIAQKEKKETQVLIEESLEPIYEELEALRTYIRETENIEKVHMNLIIASYRFRLIQLCKQFLKQGYVTQMQYDQLSEFYKLYTGLGGNGQAENYCKKAFALPIKNEE